MLKRQGVLQIYFVYCYSLFQIIIIHYYNSIFNDYFLFTIIIGPASQQMPRTVTFNLKHGVEAKNYEDVCVYCVLLNL